VSDPDSHGALVTKLAKAESSILVAKKRVAEVEAVLREMLAFADRPAPPRFTSYDAMEEWAHQDNLEAVRIIEKARALLKEVSP
jgi:hypothetical protein